MTDRRSAIGVVGAGITGLSVLHHATAAGIDAVAFEAHAEPGGVVRSETVEGRVVEHGPQRTRLSPPVRALVADLGLEDRVVTAADHPLYAYHDGRLRRAPLSVRGLLATDLLSVRGKLRLALEPLTDSLRDDETVGGFLRRAFGDEAADRWLGPLYAGLYATHPDEMPARFSLAKALEKADADGSLALYALRELVRRPDAPPVASFDGGLQALPRALADRHADRLHLDAPVTGLRRDGDDYALDTPEGTTTVDDVVLTTPAPTTAALLAGVAPDAADRLRRLTYNPIAVAHLDADPGRSSAGFLVPHGSDLATLGSTWPASLFGRERVHTCYLGGGRDPDLVERPDDDLRALAAHEFEAITGASARPLAVRRTRMPAYDRSWSALDDLSLPDGVHLPANYTGRAGIPGRVGVARRLVQRLAD